MNNRGLYNCIRPYYNEVSDVDFYKEKKKLHEKTLLERIKCIILQLKLYFKSVYEDLQIDNKFYGFGKKKFEI